MILEFYGSFAAGSVRGPADIALDARALLFNLLVSVACGVAFGTAPTLQRSPHRIQDALRVEGRTITGHGGAARVRRAMVVAEFALALAIVSGAAPLVWSYAALERVRLGFDPTGVTTARLTLPGGSYDSGARVTAFIAELRGQFATLPGVEAAGAISNLPLANWPPPASRWSRPALRAARIDPAAALPAGLG